MSTPPTLSTAQLDLDPHGVFRRYRLITPFLRREDDSYIAIRWRDVECLATDPRTRQMETERLIARGINSGALFDIVANTMLYSNGAAHRRRRAPLSRAFAFRLIAGLRPRVRAVANLLINRVGRRGEMSLLDDYAALIPAYMISDLLGLPVGLQYLPCPQLLFHTSGISRGRGRCAPTHCLCCRAHCDSPLLPARGLPERVRDGSRA
jgi:cytochrome P450